MLRSSPDRNGGYSRIIKLGNRKGDGADVAIIELLGSELSVKKAEIEAAAKPAKKGKDKKDEKGQKSEELASLLGLDPRGGTLYGVSPLFDLEFQ